MTEIEHSIYYIAYIWPFLYCSKWMENSNIIERNEPKYTEVEIIGSYAVNGRLKTMYPFFVKCMKTIRYVRST